jgi:hypothetical protein
VDPSSSHASLSRTLPPGLAKHAGGDLDRDALSWAAICPRGAVPPSATLTSFRPDGVEIDSLEVRLEPEPCPPGTPAQHACGRTAPVRAAVDAIDRSHPLASAGSVRAEVGGQLSIGVEGREAARLRVGGPRDTALGVLGRFRGRLVVHVVRSSPGGTPPVGGSSEGAVAAMLREVKALDGIWGQCGIVFSPVEPSHIRVVDPPPPYLLAVGCDAALPASGGKLSFRVEGTGVELATRPRETPLQVAHRVAEQIERLGFTATLSPNARTASAALRTVDVLVRRPDGQLARLGRGDAPLSTDGTLGVCIGEVDLADGLDHFSDLNAVAGTLEERTLIKALQDRDPSTIDVFVVGSFSRTGRIGESFIDADRSSIQNALVLDRAGIRAGPRSYAFAHELGHILLDMPGHPDDFGVDRPWMLMDADAADPTIFGPRRLTTSECERAIRQSGPGSPVPLLEDWSLAEDAVRRRGSGE